MAPFIVSVILLTNAMRTHPLIESASLDQMAQIRATYLCWNDNFSHDGFMLFDPGYHWFGENLAEGFDGSPARVVNAWGRSPSHKENIVSDHYQYIGVGEVACPGQEPITVELFGGR